MHRVQAVLERTTDWDREVTSEIRRPDRTVALTAANPPSERAGNPRADAERLASWSPVRVSPCIELFI